MKKYFALFLFVVVCLWICGCAPTATVTSYGGQTIEQAQAEDYNGPKARIAVAEFQDKTAKGSGGGGGWMSMFGMNFRQIGDGMGDMLTTALFNTSRFIVLEREKLDNVLAEQDLGASGRIKRGTEAKIGEVYGADLIITASVTEFDGSKQGVGGGTRVLGVNIAGGVKKAHIAIDLRVIDANTSQIVAATTVVGDAKSFAAGGATRIGALPVALGGFSKTPIEQAIRVCIQAAVDHIVSKTPQNYYRH
jgi:curli biogenesis system outer membrane secretion channel CsgG